jgi:hypothetical protein
METYEGLTTLAGESRRASIAARRDRNNGSGKTSLAADQLARGLGWSVLVLERRSSWLRAPSPRL